MRKRFYLDCEEFQPRAGWTFATVSEFAETAEEARRQLLWRPGYRNITRCEEAQ